MRLLILSILCVFSCAFNFEDTDYNNVSLAGQTTDETTTSETNDNTTEETATTTTTVKPKISSSTTGSTRNVEVIVTPSIYRLIDQAFRERLITFESRIAGLLEDRERLRDEIESFKPAVDEDFFNGAFSENERYFLIMIFVF